MGMLNYLGQKSKLDEIQDDLMRLQNYAKHINTCVADINACWVGNKDKQKLIGALASHVSEVNQATIELNIFKQTATFVLNIMNELGDLLGVKRPNINPIGKTPVSGDSHVNTKIKIDTTAIRVVADKIEREKKHLNDTTFSIRGTNNILDILILNVFGLGGLLKTIDIRVDGLVQENTKIVHSMRKICDLYEATENSLKKKIEAIGIVVVPVVVPPIIPTPKPTAPPQANNGKVNGRIHVVVQQWGYGVNNPNYNPAVWGDYGNISSSACGVAAASMALSSVGINKSPIEICQMNEAQGNSGDYMSCWNQLGLINRSIISSDPNFNGDIQECLALYQDNPDKNSPPIIYLSPAPGKSPHFVVVLQDAGDHYVIQDPGFPETRELPKPVSYTQVNQYRG